MKIDLEGYEDYNIHNWDAYGADPITPEVLTLAKAIAALFAQECDAAPGGDGSICLEWRNGDDLLCFDIGPGKTFHAYGNIGGEFISRHAVQQKGQET